MNKFPLVCILALSFCFFWGCSSKPKVYINDLHPERTRITAGYNAVRGDVFRIRRVYYTDWLNNIIVDNKVKYDAKPTGIDEQTYNRKGFCISYESDYTKEEYDDYGRTIFRKNRLGGDYYESSYIYEDGKDECYVTKITKHDGKTETKRYKQYDLIEGRKFIELDSEGDIIVWWDETKDGVEEHGVQDYWYDYEGRMVRALNEDGDETIYEYYTDKTTGEEIKRIRNKKRIETTYCYPNALYHKRVVTDLDGRLEYERNYVRNDYGDEIVERTITPEGTTTNKADYFYDQKGNWVLRIEYKPDTSDEIIHICTREISYYDGTNSIDEMKKLLAPYLASAPRGGASSSAPTQDNNSTGNSVSGTVQHHGAVSVWVSCAVCMGSGKCQTCFGTGHGSMSDGSCFSCGYSGRCSYCAGQGGHNEMRYY